MGPTIQVALPQGPACVHACTTGLLLPVSAPTPLACCSCLCLRPCCWPSVLTARTWHGVLHMHPVSTSFIVHDLPTACAAFVIVPMFTGSLLAAQTWCGTLQMYPMSMSSIVHDLPMTCVRCCDPTDCVFHPFVFLRLLVADRDRGWGCGQA